MRLLMLSLLLLSLSMAHLENGKDTQLGPYILDTGWEPGNLSAGAPAFFAVNVVDAGTLEPSSFSTVWVRFSKGEHISYAGTFALENGSTSFTYEFPEGGDWEMKIMFGNYSSVADLQVGEKPDFAWLVAAAFAILCLALAWKIRRKR
jgi:hypothetical protein